MPIDDNPTIALRRQFELEDSSVSPVTKHALNVLSSLPLKFPLATVVAKLKDHFSADSSDRIKLMLETCTSEVSRLDVKMAQLEQSLGHREFERRINDSIGLIMDAARRAFNTRATERVKRIGLILAHGITEESPTDANEIEEMMRVAMELSDTDVRYLGELVRIEGTAVKANGRVDRPSAHVIWEQGFWGARIDGELDSIFSKLESYGLVARIPPPNNLNLHADFQNRYVLLKKGMRFVELIQTTAAG
jgi:hypothetical protein